MRCFTRLTATIQERPRPNYRLSEGNIRFDARKAIDGWYLPEKTKSGLRR